MPFLEPMLAQITVQSVRDGLTVAEIVAQIDITLAERGLVPFAIILLLSAASVTVGRSLIFLANQVKPWRFIFSMVLGALTFTFSTAVWAGCIFLVSTRFIGDDMNVYKVAAIVAVSHAPLLNAYLGLMPYIGTLIVRILWMQSFALLFGVLSQMGFGVVGALWVLVLGTGLLGIANLTILRPLEALQNRVAGTDIKRRYRAVIRELEFKP